MRDLKCDHRICPECLPYEGRSFFSIEICPLCDSDELKQCFADI